MTSKNDLPVGFFDSGVGGVSVLKYAVERLPHEDFYFFGDCANAPYGTKKEETVRELTIAQIARMYEQGIKALVVACNTATSAAITDLRKIYTDIPVIGIEPALKPAVKPGGHPRVIVMATPGTVAGKKFRRQMELFSSQAQVVALPCPGLMEFVEQGILEGEELEECLRCLLGPVLEEPADAIVLGCTHYPFLKKAIRKVIPDQVRILDGSDGTAHQLQRRLRQTDLLSQRSRQGTVRFETSIPGKEELAARLMEMEF